jgi:hypothetical protein
MTDKPTAAMPNGLAWLQWALQVTSRTLRRLMLIRRRYAAEEPVQVIVGTRKAQATYYLHPAALKAKSGFFRGCLSGSFKESMDNIISMDDINPRIFAFFVQWLFVGNVWDVDTVQKDHASQTEVDMIDAWYLADRLLAEEFQNYCMDSIRHTAAKQGTVWGCRKALCGQDSASGCLKAYYTQEMAACMANGRKTQSKAYSTWLETLDKVWEDANDEATKNLFLSYISEREKIVDSGKFIEPAKLKGCHWHVHVDTSKKDCEAKFKK